MGLVDGLQPRLALRNPSPKASLKDGGYWGLRQSRWRLGDLAIALFTLLLGTALTIAKWSASADSDRDRIPA